ncbi:unnamed protein product (macronuclear) [Paramecium tetraurelia]|uniref:Casein kinase I n=1 Tax=Paramecium tetraurelia TaxID=5888 RepID=A0BFQ3_PARTE|nr:uncharacterized protein GSPATT00028405001 [Paramecium tetraurelia]CAK57370.1 unnamed protein product [Paramecium tetraurelia]|eukprot:XP_001424768.1 hypothetical protein (macronuclear) [Paramecium tetraurelia strain d4-2]
MDTPIGKDLTNTVIAKVYKLTKRIGSGAFGEIYQVTKGKEEYAMKLERSDTKHPQLFFEAKLYTYLQGSDQRIPRIFAQGTDGDYNYIVIDLLGQSLEDLFNKHNKRLSLKTVLMLADQMIQRIEFIHLNKFLHRDIKPDNFLIGLGQKAVRIYLLDFGLAKRYSTKDGHIPYREGKSLTGTARYASINTHLGIEQSRRDDLESLGYVLMYLLRGQLPWQNMKGINQKEKYQRIMEKKVETSSDVLCKGFPVELSQYLNYCKQLKFEEKPDYHYLRGLFKDAFKKIGFELDQRYDWIKDDNAIKTQQDIMSAEKKQLHQQLIMTQPLHQQPPILPKAVLNGLDSEKKMSNLNIQQFNSQQLIGQRKTIQQQQLTKITSVDKRRTSFQNKQHIPSLDIVKPGTQVLAPKIVTSKEPHRKY